MVKGNDLPERLKALGFPMFETENAEDANRTLADVVRSRDMRLWEAFPTILANSARGGLLDYDKVMGHLKSSSEKGNFQSLVAMSLALYKFLDLTFSWGKELLDVMGALKLKEFGSFYGALKKDAAFKISGHEMSPQRIKNAFNAYFMQSGKKLSELLFEKEELGLEYSLSQIFSPKQKDLFLKKLRGEKLTKTESEYFSRTVKKKVAALADPALHKLAQKLLQ